MTGLSAYQKGAALTLDDEQAVEELYARLARWCGEIAGHQRMGEIDQRDRLAERAITLLGSIDRLIDVSSSYEIASRILVLHRFAVRVLVKAKAENDDSHLAGLAEVFIALGEIFAAVRSTRAAGGGPRE